jgi:CheY-like chemotaxis protein
MTDIRNRIAVLWIEDDLAGPQDPKVKTLQEENADMEIDIVRNGTEALEYLRTHAPDVVILDIMMAPGAELAGDDVRNGYETGFALLRRIRGQLRLLMPVIVLTAYPKMMPENEQRELRIAEYLSKPVKMVKLAELIRRHVKGEVNDRAN